jgi:hypothetical protein
MIESERRRQDRRTADRRRGAPNYGHPDIEALVAMAVDQWLAANAGPILQTLTAALARLDGRIDDNDFNQWGRELG